MVSRWRTRPGAKKTHTGVLSEVISIDDLNTVSILKYTDHKHISLKN